MKNLIKLASALLLAFALSSVARANPINGEIHIDATGGSTAAVDFTLKTVTFNPSAPASNAGVSYTSGDYSLIVNGTSVGTPVTYSNFTYAPFVGPQTIWQINPTTSFRLTGISYVSESPGIALVLSGWGTAYLGVYDPTPGAWSFTSSTSGSAFTFSTTTSVPDGGMTALMLGLGLLGLGLAARRNKQA